MIQLRSTAPVNGASRRIVFLAFPEVMLLDLVGPWEVFAMANTLVETPQRPYSLELFSGVGAQTISSRSGIAINSHRLGQNSGEPIDTLVVPAAEVSQPRTPDDQPFDLIRRLSAQARRTVSICGGAFLLAHAGLLDGKTVATHWKAAEALARAFPKVRVDSDSIFVKDGDVYTSAGVTAGIDLALALVEEDLGRAVALQCARELVVFMRRPGGQAQFSNTLSAQFAGSSPISQLIAWATDNLAADLSVDAMAAQAHMSPRNFSRVFHNQVGQTPGAFVEKLRVDAVRRHLEASDLSLDAIASRCGFRSTDAMRRSFRRIVNVSPADYRRRFSSDVKQ